MAARRRRGLLRPLKTSYELAARLARALPPGPRYGLAAGIGGLWYTASAGQRRNALDNYGAVLGRPPGDPEVARTARRAFENYGRMAVDFVLLGSLGPSELVERVSVSGLESVDAALEGGRGCIMAVPHMGSWDVGGSYAGALGYRIAAVAERFPGSLDEAVVATRQSFGLQVIPLGRAAVRAVLQALAGNSIVALLCDLPQGPGLEVSFFGRRATVPAGPAAFARKTGAPLVPACVYRTGGGRYHVHLDTPLRPWADGPPAAGPGDREENRSLMQRVVERFEGFIRARPDQWYAFRPLFQPGPS